MFFFFTSDWFIAHPDLMFHLQSMIGHCLGAAGGLEAIATVKAITTGWVHPSINQFVSVGLPRHSEFSRQTSRIRQVNNH
jgi:3-oxoacyl-(acyl-carrier-protein) synthase